MALTKDFKDTVVERAKREPEFRAGLLTEAVECILNNEVDVAKVLLRDYVNATLGFKELGEIVHKEPKSLMRMLSGKGNPRLDNISSLLASLRQHEGIEFHVEAK
jgi:DNA-binding phage protein